RGVRAVRGPGDGLVLPALRPVSGSFAHPDAPVCHPRAGATAPAAARDVVPAGARDPAAAAGDGIAGRADALCGSRLVRRRGAPPDNRRPAGARGVLSALRARNARVRAAAHFALPAPSACRISPGSGQRPSCCLEKTTPPSAMTSYWLFTPE